MTQLTSNARQTSTVTRSSVGTTVAYLVLALTWGSSFLLMKVALVELTPAQVALGRILVGAATLTTLMLVTRRRWPRERWLWGHMAVVSVLLCVAPFLLSPGPRRTCHRGSARSSTPRPRSGRPSR